MSLVVHSPLPLPLPSTRVRLNPLSSPSTIGTLCTTSSRRRRTTMGFNAIYNNNDNNDNNNNNNSGVTWCFFNPAQDPIVKEVLKEPVAFFGGMFAGILRLDLNEEPLKEWVTRTVESAGITEEEANTEGSATEAAPQEIEID